MHPKALDFPVMPFSLCTPHTHAQKIQTVDRGHVCVAPIICQLITRLSTARLCEERDDKTEKDSEQCLSEFVFPSSGRTDRLEWAGLET